MTIIYIILAHWFVQLFTTKQSTLNCGLFGGIGTPVFDKIKLLGIANDARGGDATGIYLSDTNTVTKGIHAKSDFEDLCVGYNDDVSEIMLGHDRRSSSGGRTLKEAQPFHELGIVLSHNGTLHNWKELAPQYNIKVGDCLTDSHFLTKVLANRDFSILSKYNGGATLVWKYDDEDAVYIFKGASTKFSTGAYDVEERPLYGMYLNESFYWSSLRKPLTIISEDDHSKSTIFDIKLNTIMKVNLDTTITELETVDRSECTQSSYSYTAPVKKHTQQSNSATPQALKGDANPETIFPLLLSEGYITYGLDGPTTDFSGNYNPMLDEMNPMEILENEIVFIHGRYYDGLGDLLEGHQYVTNVATISRTYISDNTRTLYFYRGIMMNDREAYLQVKAAMDKAVAGIYAYGSYYFAFIVGALAQQPVIYAEESNVTKRLLLIKGSSYFDKVYHPITTIAPGSLVFQGITCMGYTKLDVEIGTTVMEFGHEYEVTRLQIGFFNKELVGKSTVTGESKFLNHTDVTVVEELDEEEDDDYEIKEIIRAMALEVSETLAANIELVQHETHVEEVRDFISILNKCSVKLQTND